jgi:cysteine desulfurase
MMAGSEREERVMGVINLDHNATTPMDPLVADAVRDASLTLPGNPSSAHALGRAAAAAVSTARGQVAEAFDVTPSQVVFTSGSTEANNLALLGAWEAADAAQDGRSSIVIGGGEHPSVVEAVQYLGARGADVRIAGLNRDGQLDLAELADLIDSTTRLVSVMLANNETGVVNPVGEVASMAHEVGALLHTDATQAPGRIPLSMYDLGADLMSISAHKMHGPRGVGALLIEHQADVARRGPLILPRQHGGGQEARLRPGTTNTPNIVGFGFACARISAQLELMPEVDRLRELLRDQLVQMVPNLRFNGGRAWTLPNTLNVTFTGADAEAVMAGLPLVAASAGSACAAGHPGPSPVLLAMGLSQQEASQSLRFSLGSSTTEQDIMQAASQIAGAVEHVRASVVARAS